MYLWGSNLIPLFSLHKRELLLGAPIFFETFSANARISRNMKYTVKTGGRIFGIKFSRPFSYPRLSPFMRFHIGPVYQISATVTVSWDTLYEAMDTGAGDWHKVFGLSSSLLSFSRIHFCTR